jgi:bacterioferritin-associated ferredoxin
MNDEHEAEEDATQEPLPSPLDILCAQIRIKLKQRRPEQAVDLILNAGPECFATEPPVRRTVPAVTAEEIRQAIRDNRFTKNKEIAEVLGCHKKTVALQRRLMQKQTERNHSARGAR